MNVIEQLITALYNKIIQFVQDIFNAVFGNWNYGVLFSWLPQDIRTAVTFIILFLFGLALFKILKNLIPI